MRALCVQCEFFITLGETSRRRNNAERRFVRRNMHYLFPLAILMHARRFRKYSFGLENVNLKNSNNRSGTISRQTPSVFCVWIETHAFTVAGCSCQWPTAKKSSSGLSLDAMYRVARYFRRHNTALPAANEGTHKAEHARWTHNLAGFMLAWVYRW